MCLSKYLNGKISKFFVEALKYLNRDKSKLNECLDSTKFPDSIYKFFSNTIDVGVKMI